MSAVGTHFSPERRFGTEKHTHGRSPMECVGHGNGVPKYQSRGNVLLSAMQNTQISHCTQNQKSKEIP
jgi:hypothetical protein